MVNAFQKLLVTVLRYQNSPSLIEAQHAFGIFSKHHKLGYKIQEAINNSRSGEAIERIWHCDQGGFPNKG